MAEEGGGGGEKTQQPTEKKLQQARDDGNVAQSKELLLLVSLTCFLLVFVMSIRSNVHDFMKDMSSLFINFGTVSPDPASIFEQVMNVFWSGMKLLGPIAGTGMLAVLLCGMLQTRFLFRAKALQPDVTKLSPMKGLKRIIGVKNLIEVLKTLLKLSVFGFILYGVARQTVKDAPLAERWTPYQLLGALDSWFVYAAFLVIGVQCLITGADEFWTRYHRISKLKMSLQDVKDEMKQTEGDPMIKGRLRSLRQSRSRRQIKKAVQESTVILANPTHYSVAVSYDQTSGEAPKVVAKGKDEMALRIRIMAAEARVPVITNPPLARALYKLPEDTEIPEEFFRPMAAVIAYVMKLKTPRHERNGAG